MNKVIFEKWHDPMVPLDQYSEYYPETEDGDDYEAVRNQFRDDEKPFRTPYTGPCFFGPMGIIPLHHGNVPGRLFNFWLGHTNFDITEKTKNLLDKTPGVEMLRIFDRYRFWFEVGKSFDEKVVHEAIRTAIVPPEPIQPVEKKPVDLSVILARNAAQKFKVWAVTQTEDGKFGCVGGDTVEIVQEKIGAAKVIQCSWKEKETSEAQ